MKLHTNIYYMWVPLNLTGKVFDDCIRDLELNFRLHQKLIVVLI